MNKAYIILAHKNPRQLLRLVKRLDDGNSLFFIHLDKRVDITLFDSVINHGDQVKFIERENTHWGGMGLVNATLNGLKSIRTDHNVDWVILLSGQDYPIKGNDYLNCFFKTMKSGVFIEYTTIPDTKRWKDSGGLYRVDKYYMGLKFHQRYFAKAINFASILFPFLKRNALKEKQAYAGSQWWVIDSYAMNYILDYVNDNPDYVRFHRYTFAPDEVFFHTILLNSQDEQISKNIVNASLMYMKWFHPTSSHPELLKEHDIKHMISSKELFARKFEQETNTELFDKIDEALAELKLSDFQKT